MDSPLDTQNLLYILTRDGPADAHVRRIVKGEEKEGYVIKDGICSCKSSHYTGDCKHIGMLRDAPPTKPKPAKEAFDIAAKWMEMLKKGETPVDIKIKGDLARREDTVNVIHFVLLDDHGYQAPFKMVFWEDELAIVVDKFTSEFLEEMGDLSLQEVRIFA